MWLEGFLNAVSVYNLLWLGLGTVIGLIVGVLPAVGANFGVALMLPLTFGMDPATAIIFLVAIHASCNYGDSVTSIMVNVPGSPSTVASCWDGYPLSQQGKAGRALGIATLSSFIGGVGTWLFLAFMIRPITKLALAIGAPEYFALGLMALGLISVASKGETIKGLIMALLGLALATVGQDEVTGLSYRFSYGILPLEAGIPIVTVTLGVFALSQVIVLLEEGGSILKIEAVEIKDSILSGFVEVIKRPLTLLRAGAVGWFIGILPAIGTGVAGIASYFVEKKYSKEGPNFGKGEPAGLVAAEVGKGACVVGDLIPTFTLGVPGSITGAILMAALIIQGIEPGPRFLLSGVLPYTVFAGMVLSQASFLVSGLLLGRVFTRIVSWPNAILAPTIGVLIFLGAFAERNSNFDMFIALVFGVFGYALEKLKYPPVCLVLGLILGRLIEANFHRSLGIGFDSYSIFITRPITVIMLAITFLFLIGPYGWYLLRKAFDKRLPFQKILPAGSVAQKVFIGELGLLAVIGFVFGGFMVTARQYEPAVRLFPLLICAAGLLFIFWRFLAIIRHMAVGDLSWIYRTALFGGRMSWQWSLLTMIAYFGSIYVLGFVVGSLLYIAGTILLSDRQKWKSALFAGISVGIAVYLLAKIVQLELPLGLLEFIR